MIDTSAYDKLSKLLVEERIPCAILDKDAFDHNLDTVGSNLKAKGKTMRICTKSVRVHELVKQIEAQDFVNGVFAFNAAELLFLTETYKFKDILLGYPTLSPVDVECLCDAAKVNGVTVTAMVDSREHLELLESHAAGKNVNLHVLVELDVSDWFLGQKVGAMRSPLNKPEHVVEVAKMVDEYPHLSFRGIMGYEGQCASIDDKSAFMRWIKKRSRRLVNELRQATVDALVDAGLKPEVVDGGGSGCHQDTAAEECVTEVAIGSLLFKPHIFDGFKSLEDFQPSMYFALQVVRQPQDDVVTAFSGGYISSGVQARPIPWFPKGLKAIPREGFGEVQTPFKHDPKQVKIGVGDHVLCRFGKAGEPLEHFNEVNVYEGGNFVEKLKTYRGEGKKFH